MHAQDQLSSLCPLLPQGNQDPASCSSLPLPRDAEAKLKKSGAPYPDASPLDACTVKQPPLQAHHVTLQSDSRPQNKIPASSLSRRVPCPSGHVGLVIVTNMKRLLGISRFQDGEISILNARCKGDTPIAFVDCALPELVI